MHVSDDLYTGNVNLGTLFQTSEGNPTMQIGAGPLGRVAFLNIVPLTLSANNLVTTTASTSGTALTLTAGTGITAGTAPDGSGSTVYVLDVERGVSFTSSGNLSALAFLVTGFNRYGARQSQLVTGPNASTVISTKGFKSILSVVPNGTSATTVTMGTADQFTFPFRLVDIGYIVSAKWASVLAQNAGAAVAGVTTDPATTTTGDPRGTFAQAGAASNGTRRLVICYHVDATQCGVNATYTSLVGVTPA